MLQAGLAAICAEAKTQIVSHWRFVMAEIIKIGIIGASRGMGRLRVGHFGADLRAKVVAACARDLDKLSEAIPDKSAKLVTSPNEIYNDPGVDAVVICLPNTLHSDNIKAALLAGKHVHCEYPLTQTLEQYDELTELAQSRNLVLHHALTTRAESLHLTMKAALAGLGEPKTAYYRYHGPAGWYADPAIRGDMFCALHIHFLDQFCDFFGPPEKLIAHGSERDGQACAVVMMQWPGGLSGIIEFTAGFPDKPGYMGTILTSDGWVGFQAEGGMTVTIGHGGQLQTITPPTDTSKEEDAASFLDEILGIGGPQCDLATGRSAIALCRECSRQISV
jgi:predicted dehydrogenase